MTEIKKANSQINSLEEKSGLLNPQAVNLGRRSFYKEALSSLGTLAAEALRGSQGIKKVSDLTSADTATPDHNLPQSREKPAQNSGAPVATSRPRRN